MITIVSAAKRVDFCRNDMQFVVNSSKVFSQAGHVSQLRLSIGTLVIDNTFTFAFANYKLTFEVVEVPDDSGLQIGIGCNAEQLVMYLNKNYLLQKYYIITFVSEIITITSRQIGSYFALTFNLDNANIAVNENYPGTDRIINSNFKIICDVYLENTNNSNNFVNISSSLYNADINSNSVVNPGRILSKYFMDIDLPDFNQSGIKKTTKTIKRYFLKLAELYNGEVKSVVNSDVLYSIDGLISESLYTAYFDYLAYIAGNKNYLLDPSINKIETWTDAQQFMYFVNWANVSVLYSGTKIYYTDGTIVTHQGGSALINDAVQYGCYIIPAGYTQLNLALIDPSKEIYKYEVWLNTSGDIQVGKHITYYIVPKPLFGREFWFKNQLGAMEAVLCEKQTHSIDVKRSELLSNYGYNTDIDEINDSYECSTGNKTMSEIEHISELILSDKIHVLKNGIVQQISIEAGSYTLVNENEDLYCYKFKYRLMSNKVITNQLPMVITDGECFMGVDDVVIGINFNDE